jgi:hypothetical protein
MRHPFAALRLCVIKEIMRQPFVSLRDNSNIRLHFSAVT